MPRKSVILSNGRIWASQEGAKAHFRSIRDRHEKNKPIENPTDHDDLCALLERYDASIMDGPSKIGSGIKYFETRENYTYGGKTVGFWVVRNDGTETDFSFITAVAGFGKKEGQQFYSACREAVYEEMKAAKERFFDRYGDRSGCVLCEVTNSPISIKEARLDYTELGFQDIVWKFREENGWTENVAEGIITKSTDGQTATLFVDIPAMVRFRQFHRRKAKLRIVDKKLTRAVLLGSGKTSPLRPVDLAP